MKGRASNFLSTKIKMPPQHFQFSASPKSQDPEDGDSSSSEATLILAKYILETGDLDGVMEFLQNLIKENKVEI